MRTKEKNMDYRDELGFYHDKLSVNSNNLWIYSAYAKSIDLEVPTNKETLRLLLSCLKDNSENDFIALRKPNTFTPPISRDELIGMFSLGDEVIKKIVFRMLKDNQFYFCHLKHIHNVSYFKAIKTLYKIRNEHRNTVWQEKLTSGYKIAFKLFSHDQYYFKKCMNQKISLLEFSLFHLYAIHSIFYATEGNKNLLWLQLKDLNSKILIKFINRKQNFLTYFGKEHVFNK